MKDIRNILIMLAVVGVFGACEKRIDIDLDDQQQKVVVKSIGSVGDDVHVALTLSRPVFGDFYVRDGEDYFPKVEDATVTLGVGGMGEMTADRSGNVYSIAHQPQPGEELTLRVEVPARGIVTAKATVPYVPTVSDVVYTVPESGYYYDATMSFVLTDNIATNDYYSVKVWLIDTVISTYIDTAGAVMLVDTSLNISPAYFRCTDYILISSTSLDDVMDAEDPDATSTYRGGELIFPDARISGQSHTIKLSDFDYDYSETPYYPGDDGESTIDYGAVDHVDREELSYVRLEVAALSRDLYLYRQTVNSYDGDELLAFFSEPVQIHSNVDGGIGIFGFQAVTSVKLKRARQ